MPRGPAPKPTALKIADGNPGRTKIHKNEPKPPHDAPVPPEHLDECALKHWNYLLPLLHDCGMLTSIDGDMLAAYCQSYSNWCAASIKATEQPSVVLYGEHKYPMVNPLIRVVDKTRDNMRKLANEMGLNVTSRSRIQVEKKTKEFDEIKELLSKRKARQVKASRA